MKIVERVNGVVVSVQTIEDYSEIPPEAYCQRGCCSTLEFVARMTTGRIPGLLIFWCPECLSASVIAPWPGNRDSEEDSARLLKWAAQFK